VRYGYCDARFAAQRFFCAADIRFRAAADTFAMSI
jgi:hypothetical protein